VLLQSRLDQIPDLILLGRRARRIILQNLLWALGYNAVALGFAAAGYLHPLLAALAMAGSSLTILANSARVRNDKTTTFTTEATENTARARPAIADFGLRIADFGLVGRASSRAV